MLEAGADVPKFSLTGTDGKTYTPESLTENGPAFVYFVKEVCTANPRALPLYNELYKAYGDKMAILANCATMPHDRNELIYIDPFNNDIPYDWKLRHG